MSKTNGNSAQLQDYEFPRAAVKQSFGEFLHNKKDGTYLGRSPQNWGKLFIFYSLYYIVLGAMFAICMQGLLSTINKEQPKWQLDNSLIGSNPGLGFRPLSEETERGSRIDFTIEDNKTTAYWTDLLDEFFKRHQETGSNYTYCDFNQTHKPHQVCIVKTDAFGPCTPDNNYGFNNARPCVFLKLNKIYGWVPEYYDDPTELPEDMPEDLKWHIGNTTQSERQQIWVSCEGQHKADKESVGALNYYPNRGFAAYYYPFLNQNQYMSPLIAVQFETLRLDALISVECRAWAKNIIYGVNPTRGRTGSVTFQLHVKKSEDSKNNYSNNLIINSTTTGKI